MNRGGGGPKLRQPITGKSEECILQLFKMKQPGNGLRRLLGDKMWTIGGFLPYTLPREAASELMASQKFSSEDEKWMFVALIEGMKGCGISNPNPSVGCV